MLVVSGGVSVGPHDHVKPAFEALGVEEVFWRVQHQARQADVVRPPRSHTLVFGLPGNPLSSIVCFCVFIEPALRRLQGERDARPALTRGRLDGARRAVRRAHDVPHVADRARAPTACSRRPRPSARART